MTDQAGSSPPFSQELPELTPNTVIYWVQEQASIQSKGAHFCTVQHLGSRVRLPLGYSSFGALLLAILSIMAIWPEGPVGYTVLNSTEMANRG